MKINSVDIKYYHASIANFEKDGLLHIKSLPYLSIVQSVVGTYSVSIDSSKVYNTVSGSAFIAPAHKIQHIQHNLDKQQGIMRAQWIFLDVILNDTYRLEEIYDFPIILPPKYNAQLQDAISMILNKNVHICDQFSVMYQLVKSLMKIGVEKPMLSYELASVTKYIQDNYNEKISVREIAEKFYFSLPTLFRKFNREFGCSPVEYINRTRMSNAAHLLKHTKMLLKEIAGAVGIDDQYYFSKLFKKQFGVSPREYRRNEEI